MITIKPLSNNVHNITLEAKKDKVKATHFKAKVAVLSDIHWDNPKCDRVLLKKHLDYCVKNNIPIVIIGDFFCLMQGRGDNRRNKSDIRPEHNNAKYLDSIVETAVEWWAPYANYITVIGYGNHETGIIKYQETDVLDRFVKLINLKTGSNIHTGGYGGWIVYSIECSKTVTINFRHKYYHGSGGGGIVTKGALNLTRALEMYENMDLFTMGHIHENASRNDVRESLEYIKGNYKVKQKIVHHCVTGTYKEEYEDGSKGWHIERGAPPKLLGGRIINFSVILTSKFAKKMLDSELFPLL